MKDEEHVFRTRKSSSNKFSSEESSTITSNMHNYDHKPSNSSNSSQLETLDKHQDFNKTKKNVLFSGRNNSNATSEKMTEKKHRQNRISISATPLRSRTRLSSAKSNTIVPSLSLDLDSNPSHAVMQRRSVSAYPALRTSNGNTHTPLSRSGTHHNRPSPPLKSCISARNDEQLLSSRSTQRSRQRVERLTLKSSSTDSSDSEEDSPRPSPQSETKSIPPELLLSLMSMAQQSKQAWSDFSNHVKLIDDSTCLISQNPRKSFASSSVFQKAMTDLYGNSEYGKSRGLRKFRRRVGAIAACASKLMAGARRANAETKSQADTEEDAFVDSDMEVEGPSKETIENAKRGWRILRQYVHDLAAEKRMSKSSLTWNMLTHTIRGLSNMERTRYELYQKYGLVPIVQSDGTVIQENTMLSERTRAAMAAARNNNNNKNNINHHNNNHYNHHYSNSLNSSIGNHSNSPKPSLPLRHKSASILQKREPYKAIGGFKAVRLNSMEAL